MRRVVLLLVVSLVGAGFAGRLLSATAYSAGHSSVSTAQMRAELSALVRDPGFACYEELSGTLTSSRITSSIATTWTKLQVASLAVEQAAVTTDHFVPTAAALARADQELVLELSQNAQAKGLTCSGTAQVDLSKLPAWMRQEQLTLYAASVDYTTHVKGAVALTSGGLHAFFNRDPSNYDTICSSIAVIDPTQYRQFLTSEAGGDSVAKLAKKYSLDPSSAHGGAYGCFSPTASNYAAWRGATQGVPLNEFSSHYSEVQSQDGQTLLLFVAPTKRTPSTYTAAAAQVLSDARTYNASLAAASERPLFQREGLSVDPSLALVESRTGTISALVVPPASATPYGGSGLRP